MNSCLVDAGARRRLLLLSLCVVALTASGCFDALTLCDATTCANGCCDERGLCHPGTLVDQCGTGGLRCEACAAPDMCRPQTQVCGLPLPPVSDAGQPGEDGGVQEVDAGPRPCAAGAHRCDDTCVADTAVATCGDRCEPCPTAGDGSEATCVQGACGLRCLDGWVRCLSGCCLPAPVVDVSIQGARTCAVSIDGGVRCWGEDSEKLPGVPPGLDARPDNLPLEVPGLPTAVQVAVGATHACLRTPDDGVTCFGPNSAGETGPGPTPRYTVEASPIELSGLGEDAGVVRLGAGTLLSCALSDDGGVGCWGRNQEGALGLPTAIASTPEPRLIPGLESGVVDLSVADRYGLAALDDGGILVWGSIFNRAFTRPNRTDPTPSRISDGQFNEPVRRVSAGFQNGCAVSADGGVWCWGINTWRQVGVDDTAEQTTPVRKSELTEPVAELAVGDRHVCAVTAGAGDLYCWGDHSSGQVGRVDPASSPYMHHVLLPAPVTRVACGEAHTCAVLADGQLYCWGRNSKGEAGVPGQTTVATPTRVLVP